MRLKEEQERKKIIQNFVGDRKIRIRKAQDDKPNPPPPKKSYHIN